MVRYAGQDQICSGVVRNVEWHEDTANKKSTVNKYILTFRLEQVDSIGNVTGYLPVEFPVWQFQNIVSSGDEVEVFGRRKSNGIFSVNWIRNFATSASISTDEAYIGTGPDKTFIGTGIIQNLRWQEHKDPDWERWKRAHSSKLKKPGYFQFYKLSFELELKHGEFMNVQQLISTKSMLNFADIYSEFYSPVYLYILGGKYSDHPKQDARQLTFIGSLFFFPGLISAVAFALLIIFSHEEHTVVFLELLVFISLPLVLISIAIFFASIQINAIGNFLEDYARDYLNILKKGDEVECHGRILNDGTVIAQTVTNIRRQFTFTSHHDLSLDS
jgi:hypothetical protein